MTEAFILDIEQLKRKFPEIKKMDRDFLVPLFDAFAQEILDEMAGNSIIWNAFIGDKRIVCVTEANKYKVDTYVFELYSGEMVKFFIQTLSVDPQRECTCWRMRNQILAFGDKKAIKATKTIIEKFLKDCAVQQLAWIVVERIENMNGKVTHEIPSGVEMLTEIYREKIINKACRKKRSLAPSKV